MTDTLNPSTFNVAEMFAGIDQPTDEVTVVTNPGLAIEIYRLRKELDDLIASGAKDVADEIQAKLDKVIESANEFRYTFHLRGQSKGNRRKVLDKVEKEYPSKRDFLGNVEPNPVADNWYATLMWTLHTEKIVNPAGHTIVAPPEEAIAFIRENLPDPEQARIEAAIRELSDGAAGGLELLAQEHDFLSKASEEA